MFLLSLPDSCILDSSWPWTQIALLSLSGRSLKIPIHQFVVWMALTELMINNFSCISILSLNEREIDECKAFMNCFWRGFLMFMYFELLANSLFLQLVRIKHYNSWLTTLVMCISRAQDYTQFFDPRPVIIIRITRHVYFVISTVIRHYKAEFVDLNGLLLLKYMN